MGIEAAGIGDEVNQTELNQRHNVEKEKDGLEKLLTVSPWIFDRAELLFERSGMDEGGFDAVKIRKAVLSVVG